MSKGQRKQHKHIHVNKYAKFSKAEGALARILGQQERGQERKQEDRTSSGGSLENIRPDQRKQYYHLNSTYILNMDYS